MEHLESEAGINRYIRTNPSEAARCELHLLSLGKPLSWPAKGGNSGGFPLPDLLGGVNLIPRMDFPQHQASTGPILPGQKEAGGWEPEEAPARISGGGGPDLDGPILL
ncbi:hypothetical protein RRG08_062203 [Elysia crispata]|uniref:Uncharacterized protein n=1 Tax=Elysia crispata TaxID=231223 RepID=A0AAE0Y9H4_9GAST|nr:hypothetical protein RRG08_062203 [Elysia crispata]